MRVLLIKTSSMGDVIHTLPALTDALSAIPDLQVDWVVEEGFADLARRHPAVHQVFPCALRRWRKHPFKARRSGEWATFKSAVQASKYDAVIDAQGLIKSAFVTRLGWGPSFGLDKHSAREGLSARVLDHPLAVAKGQHAIDRVRQLFALALGCPGLRPAAQPCAHTVESPGTTGVLPWHHLADQTLSGSLLAPARGAGQRGGA